MLALAGALVTNIIRALVAVVALLGHELADAILAAVGGAGVAVVAHLGRNHALAVVALALLAGVLGRALGINLAAIRDRLHLTGAGIGVAKILGASATRVTPPDHLGRLNYLCETSRMNLLLAVLAHGGHKLALAGGLLAAVLGALVLVVADLGHKLALAGLGVAAVRGALLAVVALLGHERALACIALADLALVVGVHAVSVDLAAVGDGLESASARGRFTGVGRAPK
jgi:hypothetical protein